MPWYPDSYSGDGSNGVTESGAIHFTTWELKFIITILCSSSINILEKFSITILCSSSINIHYNCQINASIKDILQYKLVTFEGMFVLC